MSTLGHARLVPNPRRERGYGGPPRGLTQPISFHRTMPGYAPTPVVGMPELARIHQVAGIAVKNEQERLGLPSFKLLGSSWALHERVKAVAGLSPDALIAFPDLSRIARGLGPPTLCTASDGNHGRAVAALAEALGCGCVVLLPADSAASRIDSIKGHGATVELVDGSYDDAVAAARATARARGHWYCPDTVGAEASDEERRFASDVMTGYGTLFEEFFEQILRPPDLLFVQAGVGGLSAAAAASLRRVSATAKVVVVEPEGSNAIALSFGSGAPVSVPDTQTVMACLRCQSASFVAWPILLAGVDAAMVVTDDEAAAAVRQLARRGVIAGASGAAGLAGALVASADGMLRARLGITPDSQVAVVNTEGATDPASYAAILAG
ncbi:MAG: diaminopropionate ammonia-lyase [Chloroflexi bacterium]|nr:MAG: diaminopropionate ammonia-lyase [Chloroflexota bacterium]TMG50352.1 MAG: diaminopropionate ammonia-lyase [Chloroflexota bacterium]